MQSVILLQRSQRSAVFIINVTLSSRRSHSSVMAKNGGPPDDDLTVIKCASTNSSSETDVIRMINGPSKTRCKNTMKQSLSSGNISLSTPIGYIKSCFKSKNGTPRQPTVCSYSRAKLRILKSVFVCPDHALDGLAEFSHVWVLFVFHQNSQETFAKAKVKPPRLDGRKVGVFASRSPHRPNPIGQTLARLDKVEGDTLYLSGMDMIDGTPVLDIKPYVPEYDSPRPTCTRTVADERQTESSKKLAASDEVPPNMTSTCTEGRGMDGCAELAHKIKRSKGNCSGDDSSSCTGGDGLSATRRKASESKEDCEQLTNPGEDHERVIKVGGHAESPTEGDEGRDAPSVDVRVAGWVSAPPIRRLSVRFTPSADAQLAAFWQEENEGCDDYKMEFLHDASEARCAIRDILSADPRSVYRRKECTDRLYFFTLGNLHITSWFGPGFAEVLHIQPISQASVPNKTVDS